MANQESPPKNVLLRLLSTLVISAGGIGGILWFIGYLSLLAFQKELHVYGLTVVPTGYWKDILVAFVNDGIVCYGNLYPLCAGVAILLITGICLKNASRLRERKGFLKRMPDLLGIAGVGGMILVLFLGFDLAYLKIVARALHLDVPTYSRFLLYGFILPALLALAISLSSRTSGHSLSLLLAPRNLLHLAILGLLFLLVPFLYGARVFDMELFEVQFLDEGSGVFGSPSPEQSMLSPTTFYLGEANDRQIFIQFPPMPASLSLSETKTTPRFTLRYEGNSETIRSLFEAPKAAPSEKLIPIGSSIVELTDRESHVWKDVSSSLMRIILPDAAIKIPLSNEEISTWTGN